jgi:hypothetical protein
MILQQSTEGANESPLERELDTFFEKASLGGADSIAMLTPEERAAKAKRGAFLEDEIYLLRERLQAAENAMMQGEVEIDMNFVRELRDELEGLKMDYIELVGNDTPLYFGRNSGGGSELQ